MCCLERCTHTRLLCAAICAFCALFCFVQLPSPCSRTATKKPTWLLCGAALSARNPLFWSGKENPFGHCGFIHPLCRRKVHNGKRGELLWEAAADIHDNLATSVQMYSTSELQQQSCKVIKIQIRKYKNTKKIHPCHHRYKCPDFLLDNKRRQKPAHIHENLAEEGKE